MMSAYTGKRFINPLNKNIGRRTGRDFRAGKKIRVGNDGFENFDDYFSESDAEVTREYSRRHASTIREESESAGTQESCSDEEYKENQPTYSNTVSQSLPNATLSNTTYNNITSSQSLSQGGQNRSKFGWLRNRDIGRRTGKNITANKQIRIDEQGFENFDDYLSESDVSSLSSRLSVSVVKPVPRRSAVSNLVVGNATPSLASGSQGSQENGTTDDDGSWGDGADSQTELREHSQTRSSNLEHDPHHNTSDSEIEDETFTLEDNKSHSIHKHTDESEIKKVDKPEQSEQFNESSVNDETEEHKSKEETSMYQLTQSKNVKPQHIDTPLSSRRSRSKLPVATDEYPDVNNSYDNRQEKNTNKVIKQSANHRDESDEPGRHKTIVECRTSEKKSKSIKLSKVSTEHNSEDETEIENEQVGNDSVEESDNDDGCNKDLDEKEDSRNSPDENDSEDKDSDKGEEESVVDNESDLDVIEKDKNNTDIIKGKSFGNNTVQNLQMETRETESFIKKEIEITSKTDSNLSSEAEEFESENGSKDEEEEDADELRPSQAHTNIDVAGNRSGSITKLDIPTSVVSFNRTRKRLSYSAGEASEETSQRNRSRIEKANAELFETEQKQAPKKVKANLSAVSIKDKSKNAADIKVKKLNDSEPAAEESSDFLCLASRSTYPQQTHNTDFPADEEDDIEMLDYEKPKVSGENEKNKNAKNKTTRQTKSTDTDSHSDNDKQEKSKNIKQGSKSEIKKPKSKDNRKGRRKTTHDSSKINSITVNSRKGTQNLKLDSENKILDTDMNDEKLIDVDEHSDMTDEVLSNESGKTVKRNRLKDKKLSNKSCNSKENINNKSKKKSKSQSDLEIADETETNNVDRNIKKHSAVLDEDERITDDCETTESIHRKQSSKKGLKKANKRKKSTVESSQPVKEEENTHKRKLIQKETENSSEKGLSNENESHSPENHSGGKSVKKQNEKRLRQSQISKCEANVEHVQDDKQSQDEKLANKSLKRKSSSDDCIEDNEEAEFQTKKTRKSKGTVRSKGRRKNSKQKSSGSSSSDNNEGIHTANIDSNSDLDELGKRTPAVDTRLSAPLHFGSGVSFRVSRRSELLEDIGSGYIGEGHVHKEPVEALTPCIARPGGARKSKGRRVTICPEENIEHDISGNKSSDENCRRSGLFRSSMGTSGNSTPLPGPDSTPVHFAETTHTATPHPRKPEESVIEDRLIKPSPPEEGLRRSQRTRLKPIAWYKNEQIVFDYRRRSGPAIIGVKPSLEVKWNKLEEQKRKKRLLRNQIRNASKKVNEEKPYRKLSIHKPLPKDIEVEEVQNSEITVFNQNTQAEAEIDCIGKRDAYKPVGPSYETPKKEDPFVITKLLDHPCMTAGKLHIKPNAEKPEQIVVGDYTVFFMEYGKVLVTIHKTSFLVETGDTFMVPVGNTYSISNLRADTAKLFYTVHKEVDYNDKSADGSAAELT